jgi:ABC-type bacteriocin/lantibiotic exporter with double-glycine peptidase domain
MQLSLSSVPIILILSYCIKRVYINAAEDLTRLEGIPKSPLLNYLSESILGMVTIIAYHYEVILLKNFLEKFDDFSNYTYSLDWINKWFSLSLSLLSFAFYLVIILLSSFL